MGAIKLKLSEADEQKNLVKWLEMRGVEFFAVPNGGSRNVIEAADLKRQGVRAGVPDLVLVDEAPRGGLHVVIEMKKKHDAKTSDKQKRLHEIMREQGWIVLVPPKGESASWIINELIKLGY